MYNNQYINLYRPTTQSNNIVWVQGIGLKIMGMESGGLSASDVALLDGNGMNGMQFS